MAKEKDFHNQSIYFFRANSKILTDFIKAGYTPKYGIAQNMVGSIGLT